MEVPSKNRTKPNSGFASQRREKEKKWRWGKKRGHNFCFLCIISGQNSDTPPKKVQNLHKPLGQGRDKIKRKKEKSIKNLLWLRISILKLKVKARSRFHEEAAGRPIRVPGWTFLQDFPATAAPYWAVLEGLTESSLLPALSCSILCNFSSAFFFIT